MATKAPPSGMPGSSFPFLVLAPALFVGLLRGPLFLPLIVTVMVGLFAAVVAGGLILVRRRAAREDREVRERYRRLVEESLGLICVHDLNGILLSVNPAAAKLLGYQPEDGIGRSLREFLAPEVRHLFDDYLLRIQEKGSDSGCMRLVGRDGTEMVWMYRNVLCEEADKPPYVLGHALDVTELTRARRALEREQAGLEKRVAERTAELERTNERLRSEAEERRKAEQALRESEGRFRAVFAGAAIGMALSDLQGRYIEVNPAYCAITGYTESELLAGRDFQSITHPEDLPFNLKLYEQLTSGEIPSFVFEKRYVCKRGEIVWVRTSVSALREGQGMPSHFVALSEDITEGKRAEEALRKSETRLRRLVDSDIIGIAFGDLSGRITDANDYFLQMVGYTREDLLAGNLRSDRMTPPEHASRDTQAIEELKERGTCPTYEKEYIRKDGSRVSVLVGMALLDPAQGTVVACFLDITERQKMEQALRRQGQMMDQIREAVVATDLDGYVKSWNRGAERRFGYRAEEMLGKHISLIYPEEERAYLETHVIAALREKGSHEVEVRARDKSGQTFFADLYLSRLRDESGAPVGMIGAVLDITERKRLEEQLRQSQKMEAVGRLAGGVAHDFNNLLTVIMGYTQMLLGDLRSDEPLRGHMLEILVAAERASALTQQLLAFSRRQVLQPKVLNLNDTVVQTERMLQRVIGEDIELVTELEPQLGRVKADPGQIGQVILNLALNARDAMPRGGRLTIRTGNVDLGETAALSDAGIAVGRYVRLTVTDTGIGMNAETQSHLFEPFFTTKETGKGTGLGLSTVYGIVRQSGGHVEFESQPGQGSTFRVYLPRVEEEMDAGPEEQSGVLARGAETVLLVEDEPAVRRLVRDLLEREGYTVIEAADGQEALQQCREGQDRMDLLLTDVVLPHISGWDLADRIAELRPGIPVLYMSGYPLDARQKQGLLQPGTSLIQKPFGSAELSRKVREVLETPRSGAPGA